MKETFALALLAFMVLASAEVSQDDAGIKCKGYALEGETIQVSMDLSCDGFYWICDFKYYGESQLVMIAVDKASGIVPDPINKDKLGRITATKFARQYGEQSILSSPIVDSTFVIGIDDLNSTFTNYMNVMKSLKGEYVDIKTYNNFTTMLESLVESSGSISDELGLLMNASGDFLRSPNCYSKESYVENLNHSIRKLENFSRDWLEFIERYNTLADSVNSEGYIMSKTSAGNARVVSQRIEAAKTYLENYVSNEQEYVKNVLPNMGTRILRKQAKDQLEIALDAVEGSQNKEAVDKYNEAMGAFEKGEFPNAIRLSKEAVSLASVAPDDGDDQKTEADYSFLLVLLGVLVALLLIALFIRRGEGEEEEEEEERPRKPKKKESWSWTKEKESSMEKASGL
jgi:hypothetical protein